MPTRPSKTTKAGTGTARVDCAGNSTMEARQAAVLAALAIGGSLVKACQDAAVPYYTAVSWQRSVPEFKARVAVAREEGIQRLEDHALERAMDRDSPSDVMTIFLLKAMRPDVYRERVDMRHSGGVSHEKRVVLIDETLDPVKTIEAAKSNGHTNGSANGAADTETTTEEDQNGT